MVNPITNFERPAGDLFQPGAPLQIDWQDHKEDLRFDRGSQPSALSLDGQQLTISNIWGGGGGATFDQLIPGSTATTSEAALTNPTATGTPTTAGDAAVTTPTATTTAGDAAVTTPTAATTAGEATVTTPTATATSPTGESAVANPTATSTTGAGTAAGSAEASTAQPAQPAPPQPGYQANGQPIPGYTPDPFNGAMVPMWMRLAPVEDQPALQALVAKQIQESTSSTPSTSTASTDGSSTTNGTDTSTTTPTDQPATPTTQTPTATTTAAGDGTATTPAVGNAQLATSSTTSGVNPLNPNSYFISQDNSQAQSGNENCGPTSLAMALEAFGKISPSNSPEQTIESVRQLMTGADNVNDPTYGTQIATAAQQAGLSAQQVNGLSGIDQALASGQMVISAGNPDRPGAGVYGDSLSNAQYNHFNGRHIILVTGKVGNDYVIDDPLSKVGALTVTANQLQAFLADPTQPQDNGGIAVGPQAAAPATVTA